MVVVARVQGSGFGDQRAALPVAGRSEGRSMKYGVLSTQYSVLSTQYSVLRTPYSASSRRRPFSLLPSLSSLLPSPFSLLLLFLLALAPPALAAKWGTDSTRRGGGMSPFLAPPARAAEWATGPALQRRLAAPVDIMWSENTLRHALGMLSQVHRVAIVLDRRVAPDQQIDLEVSATPLGLALRQIAERCQLTVAMLGPVAYFGPPGATSRLRTLSTLREEDARKLPPAASKKLLQSKALAWDDFAAPRALVEKLAREGGVDLTGLELVPHDLWSAAEMPPLPLVDRITLLANQFDLTFQIAADGSSLQLVPVPDDVALTRSYPGGRRPPGDGRRLRRLGPRGANQGRR